MPCFDYRDAEDRKEKADREQAYLDKMTRMLCEAGKYYRGEKTGMPQEVLEWWDEHMVADKKRDK